MELLLFKYRLIERFIKHKRECILCLYFGQKMRKKFEQLVRELCTLKKLDNPETYIEGSPIDVNGVMCALIHNEKNSPDRFFLYVVFGYAPPGKEASVFRELLRQNHSGFEGRGPGFCISANTGKVGHVISIGIDETKPSQLASSMVYYASKALRWREDFMLEKLPKHQNQQRFISRAAIN